LEEVVNKLFKKIRNTESDDEAKEGRELEKGG
jgi:hypothetical protein